MNRVSINVGKIKIYVTKSKTEFEFLRERLQVEH